ncbi:UDP-N-acetylmuramate--L-alanine ligase [Candidatus Gottesmanbacteria bacterium RBG_16_43_7]|uniref:UDP-N-acetylmuramate--L-alanine ligase n=1 Tax=Candidatus Gottesmanbacteria bacterium RBG_16_43_7 TaxID=1798373 RepID=A0A1F5Z8B1_9BACT|nr:MAG: UDP-N-acetylmuramate--L-alanine ligase [Candidatus Gottesmanbacteria bacterium RBG_16_43_7]
MGIKGVAMTALAVICAERGYQITGSDVNEVFQTDEILAKIRLQPLLGFSADNIIQHRPDAVIFTGAHGGSANIEVKTAQSLGIPVYSQAEALGMFMSGYRQLSVCGCHGKTTTTAMLAVILTTTGVPVSYSIGCGMVCGLGVPGHATNKNNLKQWFIAEADEYVTDVAAADHTPRFMWQKPEILLVTNVDWDHPDVYKNLTSVKSVFQRFAETVPIAGKIIINADDPNSDLLKKYHHRISVGLHKSADFQIRAIIYTTGLTRFNLITPQDQIISLALHVPGRHNVQNAAMAAVAANLAGVDWSDIKRGLLLFCGTKRRFEFLRQVRGIDFYDDYAHHPAEIKATISGIRLWYPKRRIITVFQPHTYSRTISLLGDFAQAFGQVTVPVIMEIYASARESDQHTISSKILTDQLLRYNKYACFAASDQAVVRILRQNTRKGDLVIFMGAGDIFRRGQEIINLYQSTYES